MNRRIMPILSFAAILLSLNSCVLGGNGVVVEMKSKEYAPAWIDVEPMVLNETEVAFTMVTLRDRLLDLPLGIRQTQQSALESMERGLQDKIKSDFEQISRKLNFDLRPCQSELDQKISRELSEGGAQLTKVEDIYFEKLRDQSSSSPESLAVFHRVYVLTQFPREQYPKLLQNIRRSFKDSKSAPLKRFGEMLQSESFQQLSH